MTAQREMGGEVRGGRETEIGSHGAYSLAGGTKKKGSLKYILSTGVRVVQSEALERAGGLVTFK